MGGGWWNMTREVQGLHVGVGGNTMLGRDFKAACVLLSLIWLDVMVRLQVSCGLLGAMSLDTPARQAPAVLACFEIAARETPPLLICTLLGEMASEAVTRLSTALLGQAQVCGLNFAFFSLSVKIWTSPAGPATYLPSSSLFAALCFRPSLFSTAG